VERRVFARITAKTGRPGREGGVPERNGIPISIRSRG
jgi:hypothetical protein